MKKIVFIVVLAIAMAIMYASPRYGEAGEWPNIGHTEWKKSVHGGNETTKQYYDRMTVTSHESFPESFSSGPSLEDNWFPVEGNDSSKNPSDELLGTAPKASKPEAGVSASPALLVEKLPCPNGG
jgi:hypothetical protein